MRIFVAGGSGTIGVPLVRSLVQAGHQVSATTRSAGKQGMLRALGATPVVVDALDADALAGALRSASPTHVIHQLTALPGTGPRRASDLEPTNRLRDEGTRNLLRAAIAVKATRMIVGSFALIGATAPPPVDSRIEAAADAVRSMESQVTRAARAGSIEGIVLRYGMFYGAGSPSTQELVALARRRRLPAIWHDRGQLPYIHLDDAVSATIAALDRGRSGETYVIVDDQAMSFSDMVRALAAAAGAPRPFTIPGWLLRLVMPYMARLLAIRLPLSNAKAAAELRWHPRYPTIHEGLARMLGHDAPSRSVDLA
jgi:nucleoside-diphosphate-sugar epimerase